MVGPVLKACKQCSYISEDDYLAVVDFEKSEIAKKMGISANGRYALKVR